MTKTPVTYRETLQGILEVHEIEKIILDNLIKTQKFVFRNHAQLMIGEQTAKRFHKLLAGNLFDEAGTYRTHDIELGDFKPPEYFYMSELMKNWENDYRERSQHISSRDSKIELCAWVTHRFLWIHPFFDYNGRVGRLLGELFLLKNDLPIVSFHTTQRTDFVKAVKEATRTSNLTLLKEIIAKNK
ncbi:MAG: Fic family protein [Patescibacteria group bacterium]